MIPAANGSVRSGQLGAGERGRDAGRGERLGQVDRADLGVRPRRAREGDVERVRDRDVVHELPAAGEQRQVLAAGHRLADPATHRLDSSPPAASRGLDRDDVAGARARASSSAAAPRRSGGSGPAGRDRRRSGRAARAGAGRSSSDSVAGSSTRISRTSPSPPRWRPLAARAVEQLVALDAQRQLELERLDRRVQRVRHADVDAGGAVSPAGRALAAAERLVVRPARACR